MEIVCSTDSKYIMPTGIMLTSLFESNRGEVVNVHLLHDQNSAALLNPIRTIASRYQQTIHFYLISDELVASQIKNLLDNLLYLRLPGLGSSMARNYGIYLAKGKYIQFIEGDDYLLQPTYEHCLDIVRFHNPDIVTFCFSKDDIGEPSYELPTPISGTEYLNNNTLLGSACSYIFRRAIVGSLLFSPNISFGEDEEFTPQLFLRAERIFKTQTSPYYNRVDKYAPGELENKDKIDIHMDNKLEV